MVPCRVGIVVVNARDRNFASLGLFYYERKDDFVATTTSSWDIDKKLKN